MQTDLLWYSNCPNAAHALAGGITGGLVARVIIQRHAIIGNLHGAIGSA